MSTVVNSRFGTGDLKRFFCDLAESAEIAKFSLCRKKNTMAKAPRCPKCGSLDTATTWENKLKKGFGLAKEIRRTVFNPAGKLFDSIFGDDNHQAEENEYVCHHCGHVWTDKDDRLPKKQISGSAPKKSASPAKIGTSQDRKLVLDVLGKCEHREGRVSETSVLRTDPKTLRIALQEYGISLSTSKLSGTNTYRGVIDLIISEGQHWRLKDLQQSAAPAVEAVETKPVKKAESTKSGESKPKPKPQAARVASRTEKCRIFISYKRLDKDTVIPLAKEIESRLRVKCWIDLSGIESSEQFEHKICKALDAAELVLFMYSKHHLNIDPEQDWTLKELGYARHEHKRVLLVNLDRTELYGSFLLNFNTTNNIDLLDPEQKEKMFSDLRRWLKLEEPKTASANVGDTPEQQYQKALAIFRGAKAKLEGLKAFTLLKKAAASDYVDAMYELAVCYDCGRGIKADGGKAFNWYKKAADAGHVDALVMVGRHYLSDEEKDEEKAIECFLQAEEQGNPKAMYSLGYCYERGLGVEEDGELALEWYRKAAESGDKDALDKIGSL